MNAVKQSSWLFFLLVVAAYFGFYFAQTSLPNKMDVDKFANVADVIISNLLVKQFDQNGQMTNSLYTPELQRIPKNHAHRLKLPEIMIQHADKSRWKINAKSAQSIHDGEQITLHSNVVVQQDTDPNKPGNIIRTEELIYYPKKKLITSAVAVLFEQPGSAVVHSQGMKAYLADKHVQLLNKPYFIFKPANV